MTPRGPIDDPAAPAAGPADEAAKGAHANGAPSGGATNGHAARDSEVEELHEEEPAEVRHRPQTPRGLGFGLWDVLWFFPRLLLRLFFPKLLDRYIMGELTGPLLFGWTLFIILFVFSVNLF